MDRTPTPPPWLGQARGWGAVLNKVIFFLGATKKRPKQKDKNDMSMLLLHVKSVQNCLKAMGKSFHPDCFCCAYCGVQFANSPFYLEDGLPYCETDWNELFTTKCVSCGFPIEAGDRWVEAINNNYHSQCFNCTLCKKNLEGQSFFVKAGKPFCKGHATRI